MNNRAIEYRIEAIGRNFIHEISSIHARALPDDFCTLLGHSFLKEFYYPALINSSDMIGICAVNNRADILGYVFFLKNDRFFKDLLFNNFSNIFFNVVCRIYRPSFFCYLAVVFILIFIRKKKSPESDYELNYIAIDPQYQGCGIGQALLSEGLCRLRAVDAQYCWLKTLKNTDANIRLYNKTGFKIYDITLGRVYMFRNLIKT